MRPPIPPKRRTRLITVLTLVTVAVSLAWWLRTTQFEGELPESIDLFAHTTANAMQSQATGRALALRVTGPDPHIVFPLAGEVRSRYLELTVAMPQGIEDITVYYGLDGKGFAAERSWTSHMPDHGDTMVFALEDGRYDRIRIDLNPLDQGGSGEITDARLRPVFPQPPSAAQLAERENVTPTTLKAQRIVHPGESFWIRNVGESIVFNPRFVAEGGVDASSYNALLTSLASRGAEAGTSREGLLLEAWRFLGDGTTHHCSPGRDGVSVADALDLVVGYGYGCCSHTNRALVRLADHLGFDTRFVSTFYHEYPEIRFADGWQILDANRKKRWFDTDGETPLVGLAHDSGEPAMARLSSAVYETTGGKRVHSSEDRFADEIRDHTDRLVAVQAYRIHGVDPDRHLALYPGEMIRFSTGQPQAPIFHDYRKISPPSVGHATLTRKLTAERKGVDVNDEGAIVHASITAPLPIVSLSLRPAGAGSGSIRRVTIGDTAAGHPAERAWIIPEADLDFHKTEREVGLAVHGDASAIDVEIVMQYNTKLFGIEEFDRAGATRQSQPRQLDYRDDSGDCARRIEVGAGSRVDVVEAGTRACLRDAADLPFSRDYFRRALSNLVRHATGCRVTRNGIQTEAGERCSMVLALPKGPYTSARLKTTLADRFTWKMRQGDEWRVVEPVSIGFNDWLEFDDLPATDEYLLLWLKQSKKGEDHRVLSRGFSYEQGPPTMRPGFYGVAARGR